MSSSSSISLVSSEGNSQERAILQAGYSDIQEINQRTANKIAFINRDDGNGSFLDHLYVLLDISQEEAVPLKTLLMKKIDLMKDQNEKLTYRNIFATVLCLELALVNQANLFVTDYKSYCNTLRNIETSTSFELNEKDGNDVISFSMNCKSTEGFIFFYRIAGKFLRHDFTDVIMEEEEWGVVKQGTQSKEEEVRVLAEELMQVKLHASHNKTLGKQCTKTMIFLRSLSGIFKKRGVLKETFSTLHPSAKLWNALVEFQRIELAHSGSFRHHPTIIETIDGCINKWLETCEQRLDCYSENLEEIKRGAPAKRKVQYLKQYATHEIGLISEIPISNYVKKCKALQLSLRPEMDLDVGDSEQEKPQELSTVVLGRVSDDSKRKREKQKKLRKAEVRKIGRKQKAPVQAPVSAPPPSVAPQYRVSSIAEKFPYSPRVIDWFSAHPRQLSGESYVELPVDLQKKQHLFHGFSRAVDDYILKFGFQSTWHNPTTNHQDLLYAAPGEIKKDGDIHRGLFIYTIGMDGMIYHRYFTIRPEEELMRLAYSSFDLVDFPTIEQAEKLSRQSFEMQEEIEAAANATVHLHPIFGSVHITDHIHGNAELILYPNIQCF